MSWKGPYEVVERLSVLDYRIQMGKKVKPFFMPPTSEKLRGHIGLGLSIHPSVRQSVCPSVRNLLAAEKLKNRLC